ncbi:MAG: sel1 repeat family protein [Succinivibrionaceae bacterium]|nr:sel1 repeat family protein [Succinivibrionaceae bacterium]
MTRQPLSLSAAALAAALTLGAPAPAFALLDCKAPPSEAEATICRNDGMLRAIAALTDRFQSLLLVTHDREGLQQIRERSLPELRACKDEQCIKIWIFDAFNDLTEHSRNELREHGENVAELADVLDIRLEGIKDVKAPTDELQAPEDPRIFQLKTLCATLDTKACEEVGRHYISGDWVEKNEVAGMVWYEISCKLGGGAACGSIGAAHLFGAPLLKVRRDNRTAFVYLKRSCDNLGYADACDLLGNSYYKGQAVRKSLEKASRYHAEACKLRGTGDCEPVGLLGHCQKGDSEACASYELGFAALAGRFNLP